MCIILDEVLYTDDDLKAVCRQLTLLPQTEERDAANALAKEMLKQKKRRELFDYVQQFLKKAALQDAVLQEAVLQEEALMQRAACVAPAQPLTPPRKREFRIEDCPAKDT